MLVPWIEQWETMTLINNEDGTYSFQNF